MSKNVRSRRLIAAVAFSGLLAGVGFAVPATTAQAAAVSTDGMYHAATPKRLLDTRSAGGAVAVNGTVTIPRSVFTASGMPATGVQSVVLNLTVTGTTGSGYAVAYSGTTAPGTSSINFVKGWTGASQTTVAMNSGGVSVKVGGTAGTRSQVIVDLVGWYGNAGYTGKDGAGSSFMPIPAERFADTRDSKGPIKGGATDTWSLGSSSDEDTDGLAPTAILVNLTATGSTGAGNLAAWSGAGSRPTTSSVNFAKGETAPNLAVVPLNKSATGDYSFSITNGGKSQTQYIIDVLGVYLNAQDSDYLFTKHVVVAPKRVMNFATVGAGRTASASLSSVVDNDMTLGVEGTLTAANPTAPSYLTAFGDSSRPATSSLNTVSGQTRSNGVLLVPDEDSDYAPTKVSVYNNAGSVKAIVDVTGRFDFDYSTIPFSTERLRRAVAIAAAIAQPMRFTRSR